MDLSMGIAAFKNAMDIAKIIISSKTDNETKARVSELQSSMSVLHATYLSLQSQNEELSKLNNKLEKELAKINNFNKEAKRYEIRELCAGVVVYALKKDNANQEPMHYLCPNCYQERRKSILQLHAKSYHGARYNCTNPACKAEFTNHDDCLNYHL